MECSLLQTLFWVVGILLLYKILDFLIRLPRICSLSNRYIFITGCDTGFGNLLAKRLDSKGCHVIAGCLTEKGETELRKETSSRLKIVSLDVSSHESVVKAYEATKLLLPKGQGLWGVVNNAMIQGKIGPAEWLKTKDYMENFSVNLFGLIDVSTTFLPLVKIENGRIVNISSMTGIFSFPIYFPYGLGKFGVEAFSDGFRRQLRSTGVTVHILETGGHVTKQLDPEHMLKYVRRAWDEADIKDKHLYQEEVQQYIDRLCQFIKAYRRRDPKYVVDAYEHALLGMFPRARYLVGPDAKLISVIRYLPEWMSDAACSCVPMINLNCEP